MILVSLAILFLCSMGSLNTTSGAYHLQQARNTHTFMYGEGCASPALGHTSVIQWVHPGPHNLTSVVRSASASACASSHPHSGRAQLTHPPTCSTQHSMHASAHIPLSAPTLMRRVGVTGALQPPHTHRRCASRRFISRRLASPSSRSMNVPPNTPCTRRHPRRSPPVWEQLEHCLRR